MNKNKNTLDPRISAFIVILFGISAMFMNKALTAHLFCLVAAVYLIVAKVYKPCFIYLSIYAVIAMLMKNVGRIHNSNLMLLVVSLSYFIQKLVVLLMMGSFFVRTTTIPKVISAMQLMKLPDAIAVPLMVALRFFPTIREDYNNLKDSLRIKNISVSPVQFVIHPIRMIEYLFIPILMRSIRTSDELAASALLRGFEHINEQTVMFPLKIKFKDYFIGIISVVITAGLFYLQFKKEVL
ncbi:MAG: energy-coupling factor transporter transmembrane protein EcfT [Treponema sp.]|nr:energy-coupling factor transporter transmembrane protein EcfT [Treponema sp.]